MHFKYTACAPLSKQNDGPKGNAQNLSSDFPVIYSNWEEFKTARKKYVTLQKNQKLHTTQNYMKSRSNSKAHLGPLDPVTHAKYIVALESLPLGSHIRKMQKIAIFQGVSGCDGGSFIKVVKNVCSCRKPAAMCVVRRQCESNERYRLVSFFALFFALSQNAFSAS